MDATVTSFKHSGDSPPPAPRRWSIVITLFLDPVDPAKGTTRRFAAYDAETGKQGLQRDSYFEALQDIPHAFRGEAVGYQ